MSVLFQCPAYHKAGVEKAEKAIRDQRFFVGTDKKLWLGNGVYFWQEYKDALWWDGHYKYPVILIVDLECETSRFMDLDDEIVKEVFYNYMLFSAQQFIKHGFNIITDNDEIISAGSCNYVKAKFGIELIRYSFPGESGRPQFCATTTRPAKNIRRYDADNSYFEGNPYEYI